MTLDDLIRHAQCEEMHALQDFNETVGFARRCVPSTRRAMRWAVLCAGYRHFMAVRMTEALYVLQHARRLSHSRRPPEDLRNFFYAYNSSLDDDHNQPLITFLNTESSHERGENLPGDQASAGKARAADLGPDGDRYD